MLEACFWGGFYLVHRGRAGRRHAWQATGAGLAGAVARGVGLAAEAALDVGDVVAHLRGMDKGKKARGRGGEREREKRVEERRQGG